MASSPLAASNLYPVIENALDAGQLDPPLNSYFWLKLAEERKGMQSMPLGTQATVICDQNSEQFFKTTDTFSEDVQNGQRGKVFDHEVQRMSSLGSRRSVLKKFGRSHEFDNGSSQGRNQRPA